jgi:parvulin-like peptidyl-prolyl isomerase
LDGYNEQYQTSLDEMKNFGVSEAVYRSVFENIIYREKLEAELTKDVTATAEQVLAKHILVGSLPEAIAVKQLLRNGSDFAKLAKEKSLDTGSGANGGVLNWSTKDAYVAEFADAAFSQEIGEIGEPVQTQFGFHIIQVIAREELPLTADQYSQKKQTVFTDWLTKANEDGKAAETIKIFDDLWASNIPDMPAALQQQ